MRFSPLTCSPVPPGRSSRWRSACTDVCIYTSDTGTSRSHRTSTCKRTDTHRIKTHSTVRTTALRVCPCALTSHALILPMKLCEIISHSLTKIHFIRCLRFKKESDDIKRERESDQRDEDFPLKLDKSR